MLDTTVASGTVITKHSRLWRVDACEGVVLVAAPIDGGKSKAPGQFVLGALHLHRMGQCGALPPTLLEPANPP
jgi:hypothetical protein